MMNLFKLSEQLKDLSKDQLIREMKMPSGSVPQFLVMSELQRRSRMEREAMTAEPAEQTTVAQDTVVAAGAPQGGLAQMAQALAPKTDMAENTNIAAMAPQMPAQRMQEGGEVEGPNTARLRSLIDLQRALEEARVQTDVNRQRILRAREPSIADVEPLRLRLPESGREIMPVDEFSGLPPSMTEPGTASIGGIEPVVSDVDVAPSTGTGTRRDTRLPAPTYTDADLEVVSPGSAPRRDARPEPPPYTLEDLEQVSPGSAPRRDTRLGVDRYEPEPASIPLSGQPDMLEDMSDAVAPPARDAEEPGGPGGPGDGTGGDTDLDRLYEQDRWLALARFGLGLMSSREPTLGGAIGEAGASALDYMAGARESMMDRRMQEAELDLARQRLALEAARRGGDGDVFDLIDSLQAQQEYLGGQLLSAQTPGQELQIQTQLATIQQQINGLLGLPTPETPAPVDARPGFFERLFG